MNYSLRHGFPLDFLIDHEAHVLAGLIPNWEKNPGTMGWAFREDVKYCIERLTMKGKGNVKKTSNAPAKGAQISWCNVYLSDAQAEEFAATVLEASTVLAEILSLVLEGYSVSCKMSKDGQSIQATLICNASGHANEGIGISAFAHDVHTVLSLLLFKHYQILDGVYSATPSAAKRLFG